MNSIETKITKFFRPRKKVKSRRRGLVVRRYKNRNRASHRVFLQVQIIISSYPHTLYTMPGTPPKNYKQLAKETISPSTLGKWVYKKTVKDFIKYTEKVGALRNLAAKRIAENADNLK